MGSLPSSSNLSRTLAIIFSTMSTTIFPKNEPTDLELIPPSSVETQHPGPPSPASASPVGSSSAPRAQEPQNPRYSKLYFDPSSEKAVRLSSDLINRTLEVPDLFTTDISLATHILVSDLPSALGDKLIRARTALSVDNGSRFPQVLTLSWIEESLRLKHWQPEEGYYYVPAEVKREEKQGPFVKREGREDVELDFEEGARERREEETSAKVEGFVTDTAMKSEIATEGFGAAGREEGMDGIKKEGTATQSTLEDDASLKTSNVPILVAPALAASSNAPARSRWTAEEEQQLVRHLARPGGKLITKFKSFHAEHPSRSVGAIDSYHRTYRVRIEAAVKVVLRHWTHRRRRGPFLFFFRSSSEHLPSSQPLLQEACRDVLQTLVLAQETQSRGLERRRVEQLFHFRARPTPPRSRISSLSPRFGPLHFSLLLLLPKRILTTTVVEHPLLLRRGEPQLRLDQAPPLRPFPPTFFPRPRSTSPFLPLYLPVVLLLRRGRLSLLPLPHDRYPRPRGGRANRVRSLLRVGSVLASWRGMEGREAWRW